MANQKIESVEPTTTKPTRNKRQPFGVPRSKLSIGQPIEGYHLRWINDEPGRIAQAQDGGYAFVTPEEVLRESTEDNKVKVLAGVQKGNGDPLFAYLMKLSMEYFLEDKAEANRTLDQIDDAIRGGRIDRQSGDNRYVPEGGISYKQK
jgi:hypothetical protein